jgi:ubiquinone/menaquinone biosynthesis C-methylase UbiE
LPLVITYNKFMLALWIILAVVVLLVLGRIFRKIIHHPAPPYVGYLLSSRLRRCLYPPAQIIERSNIRPGMTVVDLGCGSGAYTPYVAMAVGEKGKVYAVDVQPAMLRQLERNLSRPGFRDIKNIEIRRAIADELPFEDDSIDLVYMVAVLPEIPDKNSVLREIHRVLRPGGTLAVTEIVQDPDYPWKSTTIRACERNGFRVAFIAGHFWNYTVRFTKVS